jgi:hypothetical protein
VSESLDGFPGGQHMMLLGQRRVSAQLWRVATLGKLRQRCGVTTGCVWVAASHLDLDGQ